MKNNTMILCTLMAFGISALSVYADLPASSKCDAVIDQGLVNKLMGIYKKDPRCKKDLKNCQEQLDIAQASLNSGIGKPAKAFWASNPKMDNTFRSIGMKETGCR